VVQSGKTTPKEFTQDTIDAVWSKGRVIDGYSAAEWRHDDAGSVMRYGDYGQQSKYGWEIDHIVPVSKGGSVALQNLQPLQWENNRRKGDSYPWSWS
jgi:5-methylcytosine-specific restriction endonuclease McrA